MPQALRAELKFAGQRTAKEKTKRMQRPSENLHGSPGDFAELLSQACVSEMLRHGTRAKKDEELQVE